MIHWDQGGATACGEIIGPRVKGVRVTGVNDRNADLITCPKCQRLVNEEIN